MVDPTIKLRVRGASDREVPFKEVILQEKDCMKMSGDNLRHEVCVLVQETYVQRLGMIVLCGLPQLSSFLHQPLHR